jgi:hypothetical protein
MPIGAAIAPFTPVYAEERGKQRWGDKTPMYMQNLRLLERLFPDALFVHLIRDGRDAALSFLAMPRGIVTETWMHPRTPAEFACPVAHRGRGRAAARRTRRGRYLELRYEDLVADADVALRRVCAFAGLEYEPAMSTTQATRRVAKPHQQRLKQPPSKGVRDWRTQMPPRDVSAFEQFAGTSCASSATRRRTRPMSPGRARRVWYDTRALAWRGASFALRRSFLWRRRHPVLRG